MRGTLRCAVVMCVCLVMGVLLVPEGVGFQQYYFLGALDTKPTTTLPRHAATPKPLPAVARQLRGRRLLFVGDSILRYTYLALLASLEGIPIPDTVDIQANSWRTKHGSGEPQDTRRSASANLLWQKEWPSWRSFLNGTTTAFQGKMCCDCHREQQPALHGKKAARRFWRAQRENRFYKSSEHNTSVDFFFMHGKFGGHGGDVASCGAEMWLPAWGGHIAELTKHMVSVGVKYDAVVFNAGLWYPSFMKERGVVDAMLAGLESVGVGTFLWVTASHPCVGGTHHAESSMPGFLAARTHATWHTFDALTYTKNISLSLAPERLVDGRDPVGDLWSAENAPLRENCSTAFVDQIGHMQPYLYKAIAKAILKASFPNDKAI